MGPWVTVRPQWVYDLPNDCGGGWWSNIWPRLNIGQPVWDFSHFVKLISLYGQYDVDGLQLNHTILSLSEEPGVKTKLLKGALVVQSISDM